MSKTKICITMGDPSGIGAEIIVKALGRRYIYDGCIPIVIGDYHVINDAIGFCKSNLRIRRISNPNEAEGVFGRIDLIDLGLLSENSWEYKKTSAISGDSAFNYIVKGIECAMNKEVDAVVTGPINKESLFKAGHLFAGHTEIFAKYTNTKKYAMLLTTDNLKVIHVTTHCSLAQACERIKTERVLEVIKLANQSMKLLGYNEPRIAVAGLNPHSSEGGLFGNEEEKEIIPAIEMAKDLGLIVDGPIPPDTVFVKALARQYDIVVAMYHDQGHIPLKLTGFKLDLETNTYTSMSGVNCTVGLPIIRTSVDHGTAFGKAGEGRANETSMAEAIEMAITMSLNLRKGDI